MKGYTCICEPQMQVCICAYDSYAQMQGVNVNLQKRTNEDTVIKTDNGKISRSNKVSELMYVYNRTIIMHTSPVYIVILSLLRGTYVYSEGGGYHDFFLPFFF